MSLAKDAVTRQDWDINSQLKEPSSVRDQIIELEFALRERAKKLFNTQKISFSEFQSITNDCQGILDLAAKINSMQFNQVLTDMGEPAKKIIEATNSLKKAAAKIQEFQKFFDILSRLIKLGQVVFNAISSGGVAAIGTLVTGLKDLSDQLNT
jgi:hypothetical protein